MGWRAKTAGVVVIGAGIGVTALYLKDWNVGQVGSEQTAPYNETAFKLDSGHNVQLRVSRCDLGKTSRQLILKVSGEVVNLSPSEIPRRLYSFALLDGQGRLHADQSPEDSPAANTFPLKPGEKHGFMTKYLLEPGAMQSSLDLAFVAPGATNKLVRVKSPDPFPVTFTEGEWRIFREAKWTP